LKVSDLLFGNSILMVSADAAEGDRLFWMMLVDGVEPKCFCKAAVVGMVVPNGYSLQRGISLKCQLGLDRFFGSSGELHVGEGKLTEMVHKNCCSLVALGCEDAFDLTNEAWCWRLQLID
jgi:hypothetical protein